MADDHLMDLLRDAKGIAQKYRTLTGKPLGITGEVAEYEAARILGVELTKARQAGYDATENIWNAPEVTGQRSLFAPRLQSRTKSGVRRHHQRMGFGRSRTPRS